MEIRKAVEIAEAADKAFSAACVAAGYKSRWDWNQHIDPGPEELRAAYRAKVAADNAMHAACAKSRDWSPESARRRVGGTFGS